MTEYHNVRLRLLDSQLDKLKSATKNETWVTLRSSSDMIGSVKVIFYIIYY